MIQNILSFLYLGGYVTSFIGLISPDLETLSLNGIYIEQLSMTIKIVIFGAIGDAPAGAKMYNHGLAFKSNTKTINYGLITNFFTTNGIFYCVVNEIQKNRITYSRRF